jgi:hypothetical protein
MVFLRVISKTAIAAVIAMLLVGAAKLSVVVDDVTAELSIMCPNPADNEPQGNCEGNALEKELTNRAEREVSTSSLPVGWSTKECKICS